MVRCCRASACHKRSLDPNRLGGSATIPAKRGSLRNSFHFGFNFKSPALRLAGRFTISCNDRIAASRFPVHAYASAIRRCQAQVPCVSAIHDVSRHVNACASHILPLVHSQCVIDWPAVNSHPQLQIRVIMQLSTDLQCTTHRRIYAGKKGQHHSIPSWNAHQFVCRLC
jgi:hypothetical protein